MHTITAVAVGPYLALGVKIITWLVGLAFAIKFRRVLFCLAALLAIFSIIARAPADLGHHAGPLASLAVYLGMPTAALIVAAFVSGRYPAVWVGRGWRL
jgi:hypothetical protein